MTESVEPNKKGQGADGTLLPETEANDLRELNLSATFLTPYAVVPTQDRSVWLSNTKQTFVDFRKDEG